VTRIMNNAVVIIFIALTVSLQTPCTAKAQNKNDEKAVTDVMAKFEETWNNHDLDAFVKLYAPDADFTNWRGVKASGREGIRNYHAFLSSGSLKITVANIRIKFYSPKVATVDCEHRISGFVGDDGKSLPDRRYFPLFIMKKENGQWLIAVQHVVMEQSVK